MKENGIIVKQLDGDIYKCEMEDGRRYDIEIMGYAGNEIELPFILHRDHPDHGEAIEIQDLEFWSVVVQSEY